MIIWDISFTLLSKFNFLQNAIYFHILLNILHIFIFNATIQSINLCLHYHNYLTIGTYILFVFMCMYVCMYLLTNNKTNKKKILKFRGIKQQPFYLTILRGGNLGNSAPCGFIWLPGGTELVTEFVWRVQDCLTHIPDIWDSCGHPEAPKGERRKLLVFLKARLRTIILSQHLSWPYSFGQR